MQSLPRLALLVQEEDPDAGGDQDNGNNLVHRRDLPGKDALAEHDKNRFRALQHDLDKERNVPESANSKFMRSCKRW